MRTIKFRCWQVKTKIMMPWEELKKLHTSMWCDEDKFTKVMQFTGLKDKNGKEIWEGDIVKYLGDTEQFVSDVVFYEGRFQPMNWRHSDYTLGNIVKDLEVIGNVFENPELLRKELK